MKRPEAVPHIEAAALHESLSALIRERSSSAFEIGEYSERERNNAVSGIGLAQCAPIIGAILKIAPEGKVLMSELRDGIAVQMNEHSALRFNRSSYPDKVINLQIRRTSSSFILLFFS